MIAAVVFDIGKVLIEWNPEGFYDALLGPARGLKTHLFTNPEGWAEGLLTSEDIA